ncbi:MAG: lysylphosphatidylglycerol synthase transmembrane domain-containing protein [Gammaproteobacteria bacterium]|nr:lysylphosphatidylglycerol synthase transmembrane domain-containing protein [Gammaproteobacteria bacterium]
MPWSRAGQWLLGLLSVYAIMALALWLARADLRLVAGTAPAWLIPAFMAMASVGFALRVVRWMLLARTADLNAPHMGLAAVYLGGFLMNITPARIGELWRSWILWRRWGVRYRRSLPLLICDRFLDLFALLLFGALGLALGFGFHWPAAFCLLAATTLAALMAMPGWARRAIKLAWAAVGRRRPRLFALMLSVCRNVARMLRPVVFLKLLSLSLIAWSMEAVALHALMPTLGGELPLRAATAALGVANVAGAMTPLPGGIVGQELTMAVLVSGLPGNSTASSMAMVGIMRFCTLWYAALLGLPFFLYLSRRCMRPRPAPPRV